MPLSLFKPIIHNNFKTHIKAALTGLPSSSVPRYYMYMFSTLQPEGSFQKGSKITSLSCLNSPGGFLLHLQQNPDSYTADGALPDWPTNHSTWFQAPLPLAHRSQPLWLLSVPLMAKGVRRAPQPSKTRRGCWSERGACPTLHLI